MPPDPPVIRRAADTDAAAAAAVWLRSFDAALPTVRLAHSDEEVRRYFREVLIPKQEVWLADAGGDVAGLLALDDGQLTQLYLAPAWRGRGLGERLLALAKQRRPGGLDLWTFQVNGPARRFYERHGFTARECTDGRQNAEGEPDIRYVWRPAPGA